MQKKKFLFLVFIIAALQSIGFGQDWRRESFPESNPVYKRVYPEGDKTVFYARTFRKEESDFENAVFKDQAFFVQDSLKGDVNFNYVNFIKGVQFGKSIFCDHVFFDSTSFLVEARFTDTYFLKDVQFWKSKFGDFIMFNKATFLQPAYFWQSTFSYYVNFSGARFTNGVDFSWVRFCGYTLFNGTVFSKGANFNMAGFAEFANFSQVQFRQNINFNFAQFGHRLDLTKLEEDSGAFAISFNNTRLPDSLDLSHNPDLKHEIDLTQANFKNPAPSGRSFLATYFKPYVPFDAAHDTNYTLINLYNTDISKIRFDYFHFRLWLDNTFTNWGIIIKMDEVSPKLRIISPLTDEQKTSIYEKLLANFKANGQNNSYEALDIEYRYFQNHSFWSFWLPDWWWRFGYEKWRIFLHMGLFLLIFSVLNFFLLPYLNTKVFNFSFVPEIEPLHKGTLRSKLKRFYYSMIYTSLLFFALKIDYLKINYSRKAGAFYVLIVYLTGLMCLAYSANLILGK